MKIGQKTAILLLSCDKYFEVANLSLKLLQRHWVSHPPIFFCGTNRELSDGTSIPFTVDEKDWIGIAHQAVDHLLSEGYDYCYLILDDHPPMAKCNEKYLNNDLPNLARELKVTVISMVGWDQIRIYKGFKLGKNVDYLLNNDPYYRWIFNLHPALWNLLNLKELLEISLLNNKSERSARMFEACAGSVVTPIPERLRTGSYRVCGDRYADTGKWFSNSKIRRLILFCIHGIRFFAKVLGSDTLLNQVDVKTKLYTDFLNGPYPMFWSGLMQNGKIHMNAVRFLRLSGLETFADKAERL